MIKRITNGKKISGIYKITYLKTGEAYIGKTTDISTRWTNHIKTVCGLEGAAHSTLHTYMEDKGLWNFTFEILEEVEKDKLSEREAYYIDFYDTKHYGLNMKKGG
ncbi:MAG: GIY-YIG nuclease family protein [Bacilli bacterium]|nr:GIY-YIG nuclease family protein [Bacilli bacterium]